MKKQLVLILVFSIRIIHAQFVEKNDVVRFTKEWLMTANASYAISSVDTIPNNTITTLYVVHFRPSGFVIVSADYKVQPVLAYSFTNNFISNQIPSHISEFIDSYSNQILAVKNIDLPKNNLWESISDAQRRNVSSVNPLLTTSWNQGQGYNQYCPVDSNGPGGHVWAGCVAVAGAQLINYWQHPTHGLGSYSYDHDVYGMQYVDYESHNYDWNAMQNGDMQEIATFLYHVAVSVNMDFGHNGSSASLEDLSIAFESFFQFNTNFSLRRNDYSDVDWKNLIKADLNNNRPIIYSGSNNNPGHAWVCDGYDQNDYFHMNWGWGGTYNGYYSLNDLTPGNHNYNLSNYIINGIYPINQYQCSIDQYENYYNVFINDNYMEGYELHENSSVRACLTPNDKDWYTVITDYNGIADFFDILVTGKNASTAGPYELKASRNGDILTIETKPTGKHTDTFIQWKCMCDNGNLPTIVMEDDNSGDLGLYSKLTIDLSQVRRTYYNDTNFGWKLYHLGIIRNTFIDHFFTEYTRNITSLHVNDSSISDLTGIEGFESLESLSCYNNNLTTLDLSQNTQLKLLGARYNNLTSLIVNPGIEVLSADNNNLTQIDLSSCNNITQLSLYNNDLQSLDISNIDPNQLTDLHLENNTNLHCIFVSDLYSYYNLWANAIDNTALYVETQLQCDNMDILPPTILTHTANIPLDNNGTASVSFSDFDNGTYDNSGNWHVVSFLPDNVTCNDIGNVSFAYTLSDDSGNETSGTIYGNVLDNIAPVPDSSSLPDISSECEISDLTTPTATDNCTSNVTVNNDVSLPINTPGTTVVTWTFDDGNGNTSTQTQNVVYTPIDNTVTINGNTFTANANGNYTYQWGTCNNGNFVPISNETGQSFSPAQDGDYAVEISNGVCSVYSDCNSVSAIDNVSGNNKVKIYPNPANEFVNIEILDSGNTFIEVFDFSGKLIFNRKMVKGINMINTSYLQNGLYFIRIKYRKNYYYSKLVINREGK